MIKCTWSSWVLGACLSATLFAGCNCGTDPVGGLDAATSRDAKAGDEDATIIVVADTGVAPHYDDAGNCVPWTCADLLAVCGAIDDGCGGAAECGGCDAGTCGGGGVPNQCGEQLPWDGGGEAPDAAAAEDAGVEPPDAAVEVDAGPPCAPKTCVGTGFNCGFVGDGCGSLASCGSCGSGTVCGGNGQPNLCSTRSGCTPKTCADYPTGTCGPVADGCGGLTADCGGCSTPGETCGGGGVASKCGSATEPCVPKTCADYPTGTCGKMSDGCGGLTVDCGGCTFPQTCGGGGVSSVCGGGPPPCTPKVCSDFPLGTCGRVSDGCGGLTADCGGCTTAGDTCGGGGIPSRCGGAPPPCTKKTCADYPTGTCGKVSDGCGGLTADCGGCTTAGDTCGGGGVPSRCGGGGGSACVNLECKQVTCPGTGTSSISGVVYDPAGTNPLYNVFVYIPNGTPAAFVDGSTCDKCADALSGYPLVSTTTNDKGEFKLTDVPVGNNIPVVIQTGKWRRQITVNTSACVDVPVAASLSRLPRTKAEGDIPKFALSTGGFDSLECLLRKVGIADTEFTNPGGGGRVNLYKGMPPVTTSLGGGSKIPGATGAYANGTNFPESTTLWNSLSNLKAYDVVLLSCEGAEYGDPSTQTVLVQGPPKTIAYYGTKSAAALQNLKDYVNGGGRVFASHFHYYWITANTAGSGAGKWSTLITRSSWPAGRMVNKLSATTFSYTVPEQVRMSFTKGDAMARWLQNVGASPAGLGQISIVEAKNSVDAFDSGRMLEWIYADNMYLDPNQTGGSWVAIAHAPEYLSFNAPVELTSSDPNNQCGRFVFSDIHVSSLSNVRQAAFPTNCTNDPMTPQEKALEFMIFDLSSRVCDDKQPPPPPTCTKRTCQEQGIECGPAPDGCGGEIATCGTCDDPLVCSTGGKCAGSACTPTTCVALGYNCGEWPDGCGGTLNCNTCTPPQSCGGDGIPGRCGGGACTPNASCRTAGYVCGDVADGCGNVLHCGDCTAPEFCGGGGVAGQCGGGCVPRTCEQLGYTCGYWPDGCGGPPLHCGDCTLPQSCGGGGVIGACGGGCRIVVNPCNTVGCGPAPDGCGGQIDCGPCISADGGLPSCQPIGCGGRCGQQGDGCGGMLQCPACPPTGCVPTSCATENATCGKLPDGCGGVLECGTCSITQTCAHTANGFACTP